MDPAQIRPAVKGSDAVVSALGPRPGRGHYRRMIGHHVGMSIARADVADAILGALADPATVGHVVGVGY